MKIGERIRQTRTLLEKSQTEFAEKIGIGQAALSAIEKGIRNVTDRNINLICSEYLVSECWLRTGQGEMFVKADGVAINDIAREFGLDDIGRDFLRIALSLSPEQQKTLKQFACFLELQDEKDRKGMKIPFVNFPEFGTDEWIEKQTALYREELTAERDEKTSLASLDIKNA